MSFMQSRFRKSRLCCFYFLANPHPPVKNIIFLALCCISLPGSWTAHAQGAAISVSKRAARKAPRFDFAGGDMYNFGMISNAVPVSHVFLFRNTGKKPLIIEAAEPSCGCTVPQFSKAPVAPGDTSSIRLTFDPKGRGGPFDKVVYLKSNALSNVGSARYELHITGTVIMNSLEE